MSSRTKMPSTAAALLGLVALLSTPASVVISQSLYKNLTYSLERDFDPVASMAFAPYILVVHPSVPVKNLKELIAMSVKEPITFGTPCATPGCSAASSLLRWIAR